MKQILAALGFSLAVGCTNLPKPKPEPKDPKPSGEVGIVFLVGTTARCSYYRPTLDYWAGQGYKIGCPATNKTANGEACLMEISKMKSQWPGIRLGIAGHSQGGGASFICASKAEQRWGEKFPILGIEPAHGFKYGGSFLTAYKGIQSPSFQWYGTLDTLVSKSWVKYGYSILPAGDKYIYGAVGARHIQLPFRWMNESVHFFDWKLKDSKDAKQKFLSLPTFRHWEK